MKQALVIVSFGTSVPTAQKSITDVEEALANILPGADIYTALTSPTIRKKLKSRNQQAYSLEEILENLAPMAYDLVVVQPTHLLYGFEYDRIKAAVQSFRGRFAKILLGKPLLADTEDLLAMAEYLREELPPCEDALVLMGHGTEHSANVIYPAFQTVLRLMDYPGAYVGTVEGWPTIGDVIRQLKADGKRSVLLAPMMLVAGDHACNDMAGDDPDSWKSQLEAEDFTVRCRMEGLGSLPQIQSLYCRHLRELLKANDCQPTMA